MAKYDIFISYSRRDKSKVDDIVSHLKNLGYKIWIDIDGIESGEAFRGVIVDAIENSEIVIFFSSAFSNKSDWTTKEISLTVDSKKYIIPIKLDAEKYNKSIRFDLINLDYIDLSHSKAYDNSVERLCRTIANKIGTRKVIVSDSHEETKESNSSDSRISRKENKNENKDLKLAISQDWGNRNIVVNLAICLLMSISFVGFFIKCLPFIQHPCLDCSVAACY